MSDESKRDRFQTAYEGQPPWDLGRPQRPFIEHAEQITGSVLDVGCGAGDNALFFAQRGQPVLGIDFIEMPLESARRKAQERGVEAEFRQMDALRLRDLDQMFDSVIDCGLFHVLEDEDRLRYVEGLAHVLKPEGKVFLMCFSNEQPGDFGPRRISQDELREAFSERWVIETIIPARFETNPEAQHREYDEGGPKAWFAIICREG